MAKIRLIHWNSDQAEERAESLRKWGHTVDAAVPSGPAFFQQLRRARPEAVIVSLDRLPMQGRDLALGVRMAKATRNVPLLFAGGTADKVERVRAALPDAIYTNWPRLTAALQRALKTTGKISSRVPAHALAGYSGTPLPKKLGIKASARVALHSAPDDFARTLGRLPEGARLHGNAREARELTLWFLTTRRELDRIQSMARHCQSGPMWICWPKKASGVPTEVGEADVRNAGLANGLVDYKICAVDPTWSGLLFAKRKP